MIGIEKTYVIGDVHGCLFTLQKLIAQLPADANIVFVGDLVDKGRFSKEVVEYVINGKFQCILGNHEALMLEYIEDALIHKKANEYSTVKYLGGYTTIESYKDNPSILKRHLEWMKTLPQYIEIDKYFITHGFALPYYQRKNATSSYRALMSNRPSDIEEWGYDWEDGYTEYDVVNIFGHEIVDSIDTSKNYIGIDTGCVHGRRLTALELGTLYLYEEMIDGRDIVLES